LELREALTDTFLAFDSHNSCGVISEFFIDGLTRFSGQSINFSVVSFYADGQAALDAVARA